ncbi:hypothetical protein [Alteromonas halophila]|uniref:Uncharacterized protein n=1 Tax=Alteromonas halophila TaxID=516698 RepID=A0A918N0M1_9ALTE|nr:hypothetical protein [Alteromonas halophila]GGW90054.1 hypothetical protein GCM10007391_25530 [Alteromonas halophila]
MTDAKVQQPEADMPPPDSDPDCPASDTGRAESCSEDKDQYDDASLDETIAAVKAALAHKQHEFFALSDVVAAETALVKKSLLVTAISTMAAFTFACCCWLAVNAALGVLLFHAGLGMLAISAALFVLNGLFAVFALHVARGAYRHITLMPMFQAMVGHAGLKREDEE